MHKPDNKAYVCLRRECVVQWNRKCNRYGNDNPNEGCHRVWVYHKNSFDGECWVDLCDGHEADDARLIARVFQNEETEWLMQGALEFGLWLDGKFIPPYFVQKVNRLVELEDDSWMEDDERKPLDSSASAMSVPLTSTTTMTERDSIRNQLIVHCRQALEIFIKCWRAGEFYVEDDYESDDLPRVLIDSETDFGWIGRLSFEEWMDLLSFGEDEVERIAQFNPCQLDELAERIIDWTDLVDDELADQTRGVTMQTEAH